MAESFIDSSGIPGGKLTISAFVIAFVVALACIPWAVKSHADLITLIDFAPVAINFNTSVAGAVVAAPVGIAFVWVLVRRATGTLTVVAMNRVIKFFVFYLPVLFLAPLLYKWQFINWVESKGYQECSQMSSGAIRSRTTWVIDSDFCIEAYDVRFALVQWAGAQARDDKVVSVIEFRQQAHRLQEKK